MFFSRSLLWYWVHCLIYNCTNLLNIKNLCFHNARSLSILTFYLMMTPYYQSYRCLLRKNKWLSIVTCYAESWYIFHIENQRIFSWCLLIFLIFLVDIIVCWSLHTSDESNVFFLFLHFRISKSLIPWKPFYIWSLRGLVFNWICFNHRKNHKVNQLKPVLRITLEEYTTVKYCLERRFEY